MRHCVKNFIGVDSLTLNDTTSLPARLVNRSGGNPLLIKIDKYETVEKPFNGVILSEAKNLTKHNFETLHFVQGEIVNFVNNLILIIKTNMSIFKAYDIRGKYPSELDESKASAIGWALVRFLKSNKKSNYQPNPERIRDGKGKNFVPQIVVGRDIRLY